MSPVEVLGNWKVPVLLKVDDNFPGPLLPSTNNGLVLLILSLYAGDFTLYARSSSFNSDSFFLMLVKDKQNTSKSQWFVTSALTAPFLLKYNITNAL